MTTVGSPRCGPSIARNVDPCAGPLHRLFGCMGTTGLDCARRDDVRQNDSLTSVGVNGSASGGPMFVEPLTERERVVLDWLATPLPQRRIASELYVSINTLKSHVKAIYRKLGVTDRFDAIECARSLELLDDTITPINYEALVTHSRALITVIDANRTLVWANAAYRELLGFDPTLHVGQSSAALVHPDDLERLTRLFYETASRPGESVTFECRLAHADGTWRDVTVHQVNRLHDPSVRGFVGTTSELAQTTAQHA
jgi:PAS domain S-box-containing protein